MRSKILLIEDDAGIADTLQRVLAEEGHEVAAQQRGDDGLARAARGRPASAATSP